MFHFPLLCIIWPCLDKSDDYITRDTSMSHITFSQRCWNVVPLLCIVWSCLVNQMTILLELSLYLVAYVSLIISGFIYMKHTTPTFISSCIFHFDKPLHSLTITDTSSLNEDIFLQSFVCSFVIILHCFWLTWQSEKYSSLTNVSHFWQWSGTCTVCFL